MNIHFRKLLALALISITFVACKKEEETLPESLSPPAAAYGSETAAKWNDLQLQLIRTTAGFVPPVAARALGYSNLAAYEAIVPGMADKHSMDEVMHYSYLLPYANSSKKYNWALVSNAAYFQMTKALYANTSSQNQLLIDSLYLALKNEGGVGEAADVILRSESYGAEVADVIYNWSLSDNGHQAYTNLFPSGYTVQSGPGLWKPTPPAYQPIPLLPYWGNNRPFLASSISMACMPPAPFSYSTDTASQFYKEAYQVYETGNNLSAEQRDIALFWADGSATYTPPGHNMNIATQLIREDHQSLDRAAEIYLRMGVACNDAFIACWKAKYTHNVLRPVTYIRENIAASWTPLITTPPFPEYTSGHSTVSGACSEVLSAAFGRNRAFIDRSNEWMGFTARSYNNFYEAAEEAAASRLYGGIHFPNANLKGIACGKQIGRSVASINLNRQ